MLASPKALLIATFLLASGLARAQSSEPAPTAQRAFDEGRSLMATGDYANACRKFEESQRLDSQLGTLLHLANCYEKSGKLSSAWRGFSSAAKLAAARNAAGENEPREATARRRAANLEWRLSSLTLDVSPGDASQLAIELDGRRLERSEWGVRQPVDPGEHGVRASAPGRQPWSHSYAIEREGTRLRILIPSLRPEADATPTPLEAKVEKRFVAPGPTQTPSTGDAQRIMGYVLSGAAIAGASVAVAFFIAAQSASSEQDTFYDRCKSSAGCSAQDLVQNNRLNERVQSDATAMYIAAGLSAAALIAGIALVLSAPTPERRPAIALSVLPGQAYVSLRGRTF